jgi:two-component system response regulator MtrA
VIEQTKRILVLTDDHDERELVQRACSLQGYSVITEDQAPDLMLMDLSLESRDPIQICREVRVQRSPIPVLLLCEHPDGLDVVLALEAGADDLIVKPLRVVPLISRVNAHLRRRTQDMTPYPHPEQLLLGILTIDISARRLYRYGHEVALTRTEFDLLAALGSRAGQVISREELLRLIWDHDAEAPARLIEARIWRLQQRLEPDPDRPRMLQIMPEVNGYRFNS